MNEIANTNTENQQHIKRNNLKKLMNIQIHKNLKRKNKSSVMWKLIKIN